MEQGWKGKRTRTFFASMKMNGSSTSLPVVPLYAYTTTGIKRWAGIASIGFRLKGQWQVNN